MWLTSHEPLSCDCVGKLNRADGRVAPTIPSSVRPASGLVTRNKKASFDKFIDPLGNNTAISEPSYYIGGHSAMLTRVAQVTAVINSVHMSATACSQLPLLVASFNYYYQLSSLVVNVRLTDSCVLGQTTANCPRPTITPHQRLSKNER